MENDKSFLSSWKTGLFPENWKHASWNIPVVVTCICGPYTVPEKVPGVEMSLLFANCLYWSLPRVHVAVEKHNEVNLFVYRTFLTVQILFFSCHVMKQDSL